MVSEDLASGRLVSVLQQHVSSRMAIHMYYARRERIPARVRQFIDFVTTRDLSSIFSSKSQPADMKPEVTSAGTFKSAAIFEAA